MKVILRKKQSGEILIFVIFIVLFLVLFISLFISKILVRQSKTADNVLSSVQAFYLADTGSEYALHAFQGCSESYKLPNCITDGKPAAGEIVPGGDFSIVYNDGPTSSSIDITGIFNNQTSRAIELTWPDE